MLTDSDISEMVKAIGARRKLIVKRNELLKSNSVSLLHSLAILYVIQDIH